MKHVIVYSQPNCPPCQVVKQFLEHHQIEFIEKDVSQDHDAREKLINELHSTSTPTVTINEEIVTGFDLKRLEELLDINTK
ncbi:glutaredoxin family protein [Metabacillus litoralis]|uniref:Glutaredoxin family protein n=1 Tax=Metabacillus litoralis TaxID=152268 RepID=A0A5C6W348_9BACI|nr:glutaredoxin family protein [Metabacillus litoralis]TXC92188.1 glutaredoxin family protein [Metabacillus litoralis]